METVFIGVGSSIDPEKNVAAAIERLGRHGRVTGLSRFYWTPAIDRPGQEPFLNGIVRIETGLSPRDLKLTVLRGIEDALGRVRSEDRYAPRTLDLDIVLYGRLVLDEPDLRIPDPDIRKRPFLAAALLDLDPHLALPDTGEPVSAIFPAGMLGALRPDQGLTERLLRLAAGPGHAKADMDTVLEEALRAAIERLQKDGELYPFAVIMAVEGGVRHIQAYPGERPDAATLLAATEHALRRMAGEGALRATALITDVAIEDTETGEAADAIQVALEHRDAEPVTAYLTYRLRGGAVAQGKLLAVPGEPAVFPGRRVGL